MLRKELLFEEKLEKNINVLDVQVDYCAKLNNKKTILTYIFLNLALFLSILSSRRWKVSSSKKK